MGSQSLVNQLEDVVVDGEASDFAARALGDADLEVLDKVYQVLVLVNLEPAMSVLPFPPAHNTPSSFFFFSNSVP